MTHQRNTARLRFTSTCATAPFLRLTPVADPRQINVLVLRKRRDEILTIVTDTRWLALLVHENPPATRVEYKHLVTMIRNFFANPEALPEQSFHWPGTQESREGLRRILNPRRRFQPL